MRKTLASAAVFAGAAFVASVASPAFAEPVLVQAPVSSHKAVSGSLVQTRSQDLNLVTPGDPFTIAVTAFTATAGAQATAPLTSNFGTTQTFANAGLAGQTVTVMSSESIGATTTTNT